MIKHTKGQWFVDSPVSTEHHAHTVKCDDVYIAEMFCQGKDSCQAEPEEAFNNAKLIAASPATYVNLLRSQALLQLAYGNVHDKVTKDEILAQIRTNQKVLDELNK